MILFLFLYTFILERFCCPLSTLYLVQAYDTVDRPTLWSKLAKLGFGGSFLASIQSMYRGDFVTSDINGVTTRPVYLGRGLRQGCSLSPLLFALYVAEMGEELALSVCGVTLYKICVSALFFAVCYTTCICFCTHTCTCAGT